jgi:hypothetical protein
MGFDSITVCASAAQCRTRIVAWLASGSLRHGVGCKRELGVHDDHGATELTMTRRMWRSPRCSLDSGAANTAKSAVTLAVQQPGRPAGQRTAARRLLRRVSQRYFRLGALTSWKLYIRSKINIEDGVRSPPKNNMRLSLSVLSFFLESVARNANVQRRGNYALQQDDSFGRL